MYYGAKSNLNVNTYTCFEVDFLFIWFNVFLISLKQIYTRRDHFPLHSKKVTVYHECLYVPVSSKRVAGQLACFGDNTFK